MTDGFSPENPTGAPQPKDPPQTNLDRVPIFPHEVGRPLENHTDELLGRPEEGEFRTPDGRVAFIRTDTAVSLRGIFQKGRILPRRIDTFVEIRDERGRYDPTLEEQVVPFETLSVHTDRVNGKPQCSVLAQEGYYNKERERIITQDDSSTGVSESNKERLERLRRITELVQQLSPESRINRYGRTTAERDEDFRIAEAVRNRIDELIQFAREAGTLEGDGNDWYGAFFFEEDPRIPTIFVTRAPGSHDEIIIFDPTPKETIAALADNKMGDFPQLSYKIPAANRPDQRITSKAELNLMNRTPEGKIYSVPPTELDVKPTYSTTTNDDINELMKRLAPLDGDYIWKKQPKEE